MWSRSFFIGNNKGSTLINILLSFSLMAILGTLFLSLISNQRKQLILLEQKMEVSDLKSSISQILNNGNLCSENFDNSINTAMGAFDSTLSDVSLRSVNVGQLKLPNGQVFLVNGMNLKNKITIDKVEVINLTDAGGGDWLGELQISFNYKNGDIPLAPIRLFPKLYTVDLTTPTAAKLTGCSISSPSTFGAKAWVRRQSGTVTGSGIGSVTATGAPVITLDPPFANNQYVVICNGNISIPGTEMQIFAYNKTPSQFQLLGAHASSADPIGNFECIIGSD